MRHDNFIFVKNFKLKTTLNNIFISLRYSYDLQTIDDITDLLRRTIVIGHGVKKNRTLTAFRMKNINYDDYSYVIRRLIRY